MGKWFVYIVLCADDSLYTGISNNIEKRLEKHNLGKGAKYTRARRPVSLVYHKRFGSKALALRKEAEIKKLNRKGKEKLLSVVRG